jgi:hypothetical protein
MGREEGRMGREYGGKGRRGRAKRRAHHGRSCRRMLSHEGDEERSLPKRYSIPHKFGGCGFRIVHRLANSRGRPARNWIRIPGLVSLPLQTVEFGPEFLNSEFLVQFTASKHSVSEIK